MTDSRRARLFGGHYDGYLVDVDQDILIRGLRLAIPPAADTLLAEYGRAELTPDGPMEERYRFDGSVNEHGEYRFRWLNEPDHRN